MVVDDSTQTRLYQTDLLSRNIFPLAWALILRFSFHLSHDDPLGAVERSSLTPSMRYLCIQGM